MKCLKGIIVYFYAIWTILSISMLSFGRYTGRLKAQGPGRKAWGHSASPSVRFAVIKSLCHMGDWSPISVYLRSGDPYIGLPDDGRQAKLGTRLRAWAERSEREEMTGISPNDDEGKWPIGAGSRSIMGADRSSGPGFFIWTDKKQEKVRLAFFAYFRNYCLRVDCCARVWPVASEPQKRLHDPYLI